MKEFYKALLLSLLCFNTAFSQIPDARAEDTMSSLQLSPERTLVNRIDFLMEVAQAYAKEGNLAESINAYERILALEPRHQQCRYLLSHVYITAKEYEKAEGLLFELMEERPNDFTLLNNLAWVYATADDLKIRDGQKAIRYAQDAMVLAPNDHHVWSTLSEAYYMTGDYEKAYRAITHMAQLAMRYGQNITEDSVAEYNEQIRKCKRALDTADVLNEVE
jgi:tetratricopeptide (TPR) repeat protein